MCSLISTLTSTFTDADHACIAEHWTDMLEWSISAMDSFRDANPDVRSSTSSTPS